MIRVTDSADSVGRSMIWLSRRDVPKVFGPDPVGDFMVASRR